MKKRLVIGTRGSKLALWQARWVQRALLASHANLDVDIQAIKTRGDKILDVPLAKVGGKGLFVKEIEAALLDGRIDLAIHSMKDMPGKIPKGLCIGAVPAREAPGDVFISRTGQLFSDLSPGSTIGTSSLRRAAQLQAARPDIKIRSIRGNLDTRLKKLDAGEFDAIVLAAAGVKRLALTHRITEYLDMETMLPAVGQGALCIEIRKGDDRVEKAIAPLDDADTRIAVTTERAFLNRLEGGCQTPIAAHATLKNGMVRFVGLVADLDGRRQFRQSISGTPDMAGEMGIRLAEQLLDQGAGDILEKLKDLSND